MIEIRLRAAAANPGIRPWQWGVSLAVLVLAVIAPAATSRAQDASGSRSKTTAAELESIRASKAITIEAGRDIAIDANESISITNGAASITMKKDGTIVLRGTEIVIDGATRTTARPGIPPVPAGRASQMSEIF